MQINIQVNPAAGEQDKQDFADVFNEATSIAYQQLAGQGQIYAVDDCYSWECNGAEYEVRIRKRIWNIGGAE